MSITSQILSQNFIKNPQLVKRLLTKTSISQNDTVLDIGAGDGVITQELAETCKQVVAVEIDHNLVKTLHQKFQHVKNVTVIEKDFLKYQLPTTSYKVFSNIPFSKTTDIITKLTNDPNPPEDSYLIIQKEAAARFMGINEGYLLSLLIKPFFNITNNYNFDRNDFTPTPNVDTVLLHFHKRNTPLIPESDREDYKKFVSFILLQQKPTLKLRTTKILTSIQFKTLSKNLKFLPTAPASQITPDQWIGLFNYYKIGVSDQKKIR